MRTSTPERLPDDAPVDRPLVRRVLGAFAAAFAVAAITALFALFALGRARRDTERLAGGLVPVALDLARLRATQASMATLVDGIGDERDPLAERRLLEALATTREGQVRACRTSIAHLAEEGGADADGFRDRLEDAVRLVADDDTWIAHLEGTGAELDRVVVTVGAREHEAARKLGALLNDVSTAIRTSATAQRDADAHLLLGLVLLSAASAFAALLVGRRLRVLLAPVGRLEARAQAVARGDLERRPVRPGPDELGRLEVAFEEMVGGLAAAQERAVTAERFAAIGKMAAHVTHEIRNPLSAIGLNLELLEEELGGGNADPAETRGLVRAIAREVARLEGLSEEYLRMARLPTPRRDGDDLVALLEDVLAFSTPELERAGCRATLALATATKPPGRVLFDEAQMRQALANLLRNAREAMPAGGTITVTLGYEGLAATITVADEGPGVTEELRASIFEPFFSTKGDGTGLGLAVTREILRAHGGELTCLAPEPGAPGARFRMTLPLAPERDAAEGAGLL